MSLLAILSATALVCVINIQACSQHDTQSFDYDAIRKTSPSSGVGTIIPQEDMIVSTKSGKIMGAKVESDVSDFYAFLRIPYAQPPVGELRFKNPKPVIPWDGVRNGTYEGYVCPQSNLPAGYVYNEDCLTMNIYTKEKPQQNSRLPVFVYLPGGALQRGFSKMDYYGPHYFMKHDGFIVVNIQFRLNIHGFLNLKTENAPGNQNLADTILGLEWIRDNIEYFGGDPNQITVGGLSSGAIMTHALMISPKSQGLFHKAIMQSGVVLGYRFFNQDVDASINDTKRIANMEGCTDQELYDYLMTLTPAELLELEKQVKNIYPPGFAEYYPFAITIDQSGIIPKKPIDLIRDNNYKAIPLLIGTTSNEGNRLETQMQYAEYVDEHFEMVVPNDLYPIYDKSGATEVAKKIKKFYFGDQKISKDTFTAFSDLATDEWYGYPSDYSIRLHSVLGYDAPIYNYIFEVDGAYNVQKLASKLTYPGPTHADDIGYNWHVSSLYNVVPTDDFSDLTKERYVTMLVNFIKNSNPTPHVDGLLPIKWKPFNYPEANCLMFNRSLTIEQNPNRQRMLFWQNVYGVKNI